VPLLATGSWRPFRPSVLMLRARGRLIANRVQTALIYAGGRWDGTDSQTYSRDIEG